MKAYLDMCCLKHPFDDQSQPRIHLETDAILTLLKEPADVVEFIRSAAHDLENDQNPLLHRAERVRGWLEGHSQVDLRDEELVARTTELMNLGFRNFDAFHVASAELSGVDTFATCDDRLLAVARRQVSLLRVRVLSPLDLLKEIHP